MMKSYVPTAAPTPFLLIPRRFPYTFRCSPLNSDSLWHREEQRWLREEQRWLREEQRWIRERAALVGEIESLKICLQSLPGHTKSEALLPPPKEKPLIPSRSESVIDPISNFEKPKKVLRRGNEGDEVRALQEALQKLGFFSGEEDIEYSSFSTGTERAVKTWQASIGVRQDGIITEELLQRLNSTKSSDVAKPNSVSTLPKIESENIESSSYQGVFLLGENRWEKPTRINKTDDGKPKCIACRGERRLLCTECEGTGEPNIEPQFLEWIEEGSPCPYCEGTGFVVCDMCEGSAV